MHSSPLMTLHAQSHDDAPNVLRLRRLGIDTYQEPVIYMAADCPVCRSEGWEAQARIAVTLPERSIIATLNVITGALLAPDEASLSESAWVALGARDGDRVVLSHPKPLVSLSDVRAKLYGRELNQASFERVIGDIAAGRYSAIELTAFVAACAGGRLSLQETIALTRAMIGVGDRLAWPAPVVADKHSVGGLPGNRTTMIVVPIIAASGLVMPKTSSRGITSPAGTADAMETLAPVALDLPAMQRVVDREGGCIVWGGAVRLSPADDVIIRIERPLDIDSEGQLVASVLSKKAAAGATHVVIDVPIGPSAKIRTPESAESLGAVLTVVGQAVGLTLDVVHGDGAQPIGRGIGPALEARDVLSVLRGEAGAPADLRERALVLSGRLLELAGAVTSGQGHAAAASVLDDGRAWRKFQAICEAQGGMHEPPRARYTHTLVARSGGTLIDIDNRRLARVAKLAGAPKSAAAGLELHVRLGDTLEPDSPLITVHAQSPGELQYSLSYAGENLDLFRIENSGSLRPIP